MYTLREILCGCAVATVHVKSRSTSFPEADVGKEAMQFTVLVNSMLREQLKEIGCHL